VLKSDRLLDRLFAQPRPARPARRQTGDLRRARRAESGRCQGAERQLAALLRALHAQPADAWATARAAAFIGTIFAQENKAAVKAQWRKVTEQMRPTLPKLAAFMDTAEEDVLASIDFAPAHWVKLHSISPTERPNGEIKRRTSVVGIFPNAAAIVRLVGAILLEQNDEWSVRRARYITLEAMAPLADTDVVSLPAWALWSKRANRRRP
jgi:hypothetical protein